jgi:phosphate transport system substrate-binding protein
VWWLWRCIANASQEATGAGASFPAPLYSKWAADYHKATGVKINYQSVGSSAGVKQIEAKTVDFGASDEPLKDDELAKKGLVQFPTVIGGIVPVVNIKGVAPGQLKLSGRCWATSTWARSPSGMTPPSRPEPRRGAA